MSFLDNARDTGHRLLPGAALGEEAEDMICSCHTVPSMRSFRSEEAPGLLPVPWAQDPEHRMPVAAFRPGVLELKSPHLSNRQGFIHL